MNTERTEENWVENVGKPAYESIVEMVAALECDYDRLEELRDELEAWDPIENEYASWYEENPDDAEELAELESAAGECKDADEARQRIEEDALSVQIRSDWYTPGEDPEPGEYELLLATGGPAVRIVGELNANREPSSARLEVQDWFKPWTEYFDVDRDTLLTYASVFYYGD